MEIISPLFITNEMKIDFSPSISFYTQKVSAKNFINLSINDHNQKYLPGTGEVAIDPIHGFMDKENLKNQLRYLLESLSAQIIQFEKFDLERPFFGLFTYEKPIHTSLLFGVESALLDWLIKNQFVSHLKLTFPLRQNVQAFYRQDSSFKLNQFSSLKIKIFDKSVNETVDLVEEILKKHPHLTLRLDANQQFSLEQFLELSERLKDNKNIEYIEDPLSGLAIYQSLPPELSLLNIALDECFNMENINDINQLIHSNLIQYLVLKPSKFGLSSTFQFANHYSNSNMKIILSSSFEAIYGMRALFILSNLLNLQDFAQGFDTIQSLPSLNWVNYFSFEKNCFILNK